MIIIIPNIIIIIIIIPNNTQYNNNNNNNNTQYNNSHNNIRVLQTDRDAASKTGRMDRHGQNETQAYRSGQAGRQLIRSQ